MMYKLILSKRAAEFIRNLDPGYKNKIKEIMEELRENPFAYPYKKIRGESNLYRIRIGKYRILYELDKRREEVVITKLDKRSKIYKM